VARWREDKAKRLVLKKACIDGGWGGVMEANTIPDDVRMRLFDLGSGDSKGGCAMEVLMQLYPHEHAPSDHPPVAVLAPVY
jgi:hypothetical protein